LASNWPLLLAILPIHQDQTDFLEHFRTVKHQAHKEFC